MSLCLTQSFVAKVATITDGTDREGIVIYSNGASSIATLWFSLLPPVVRYAASGMLGNLMFFALNQWWSATIIRKSESLPRLLSKQLSESIMKNASSISFFTSYLVQIIPQHFLNSLLVFGLEGINSREKYLKSLKNTYKTYFVTLCGSALLNAALLQYKIRDDLSFWISIGLFSVVNYVLVSSYESKVII